jgi:hypothetical protein
LRAPARVLAAVLLASCAGASPRVVEPRELAEAAGAPSISGIVDLGGGDVPAAGDLRVEGRSDGVAVVGEALWIRGSSFGRQPTVLVADRPAAVLSRTEDGGILVRVPVGSPVGTQQVTVTQEHGGARAPLTIRRYAGLLVPGSGRVVWLQAAAGPSRAVGETALPDARFLSMAADGRAAYIAGSRGPLLVVELPAPDRPAVAGRLDLGPQPIVALPAAANAPLLAVVGASDVRLVDTTLSLRPILGPGRPLPRAVARSRVRRVALSPDGVRLAVLTDGNRVALVDLRGGDDPAEVAPIPEARVPVLVDLAFAPDGGTLWVVAGDTAESRALGPQPTRVFALRIARTEGGGVALERARVVSVPAAGEPTGLATGRTLPLRSGAAVRLPPERATVYLAATVRGAGRSAVFSIDGEDAATELLGAPHQLGALDVTPEGRFLLAAEVVAGGPVRVLSATLDQPGRQGAAHSVIVPAAPAAGPPPELRVQP